MIRLTRINHLPLVLNSDLIEHIEAAPDTIISLTNGQKLVVSESVEEVIQKVIEFRRAIQGGLPREMRGSPATGSSLATDGSA
jgi:flagellar protein FlbD